MRFREPARISSSLQHLTTSRVTSARWVKLDALEKQEKAS